MNAVWGKTTTLMPVIFQKPNIDRRSRRHKSEQVRRLIVDRWSTQYSDLGFFAFDNFLGCDYRYKESGEVLPIIVRQLMYSHSTLFGDSRHFLTGYTLFTDQGPTVLTFICHHQKNNLLLARLTAAHRQEVISNIKSPGNDWSM